MSREARAVPEIDITKMPRLEPVSEDASDERTRVLRGEIQRARDELPHVQNSVGIRPVTGTSPYIPGNRFLFPRTEGA